METSLVHCLTLDFPFPLTYQTAMA